MGIHCEINLFKPSDGAYQPGEVVSGLIKYALDEPMEAERIIVSLKGGGDIVIKVKHNKDRTTNHRAFEVYVDMDYIVQDRKDTVPVGSHEIKFSFLIPPNLPSSIRVSKILPSRKLRCEIVYYIRIKFHRTGFFERNKHFRKEITIVSGATPRLLQEPVIYGETKKLMRMFSSKSSLVNMKATIFNSVIPTGEKIDLQYEVENSSNVLIKSVETKLVEIYKFQASVSTAESEEDVWGTDVKTKAINCGETQIMPIEIDVPSDRHSLENSTIISRDYSVKIEAALPFPHRNVVLYIPVQIDAHKETSGEYLMAEKQEDINYDDLPPSYWAVMGEMKNDDDDDVSSSEKK